MKSTATPNFARSSSASNALHMSAEASTDFVPLAAALVSRTDPRRELLVKVDAVTGATHVELIPVESRLRAVGNGTGTVSRRTARSTTVVAQLPLATVDASIAVEGHCEVTLAITWSQVPSMDTVLLDVAGTAFIFHEDQGAPEEFRATGGHPFSRYGDLTPAHEVPSRLAQKTPAKPRPARGADRRLKLPEKLRERLNGRELGPSLGINWGAERLIDG